MVVNNKFRVRRCPKHGVELREKIDARGMTYFACVEAYCDVTMGSGKTATPADGKTKRARRRAHDALDLLWKGKTKITRNMAYEWMAREMGLQPWEAHIGLFSADECDELCLRVDALLRTWYKKIVEKQNSPQNPA